MTLNETKNVIDTAIAELYGDLEKQNVLTLGATTDHTQFMIQRVWFDVGVCFDKREIDDCATDPPALKKLIKDRVRYRFERILEELKK